MMTVMQQQSNLKSLRNALGSLLGYSFIAIFYFHPFAHNFRREIFMSSGDPIEYIWELNWWPFAILKGINPFITHFVWAPYGCNLTWFTSVPILSLLISPLTFAFGAVLSWNVLSLIAPTLSAFCAFLLFRYVYENDLAAFFGGYLFGFSSCVLGQLLGHLNLDFVCLLPLAVLLFIRRLSGDIKSFPFILMMSLLLCAQAGIATEVLATASLFGFISILVFFILSCDLRARLASSTKDLILSYFLMGVFLFPFLYYVVIGIKDVPKIIHSPLMFSADLLNYIIPTPITMIGKHVFANIAANFPGNYFEEGAYMGIPLLIALTLSFKEYADKKRDIGVALLLFLAIIVVFSLGPCLHVNGVYTHIILPWTFFGKLPLIRQALPTRFPIYASLVVAAVMVFWLSEAQTKKQSLLRYAIALLGIAFIIPNRNFYFWKSPPRTPTVFTKADILTQKNIIVLPFEEGPSIYWQMISGMKFSMASGYLGAFLPGPFRRGRAGAIVSALTAGNMPGRFKDIFDYYCSRFGVQYVVVCEGTPPSLAKALSALGWQKFSYGRSLVYSVPDDLGYFNHSGNIWPPYDHFNWIGKNVVVTSKNESVAVLLTARNTPKDAGPVRVSIVSSQGKAIKKIFFPRNPTVTAIALNGNESLRLTADNTWIPRDVIHNTDTRSLSVGMKILSSISAGEQVPFTSDEIWFKSGWSGPETAFRWSDGKSAEIEFVLDKRELPRFKGKFSLLAGSLGKERLDISLNGKKFMWGDCGPIKTRL